MACASRTEELLSTWNVAAWFQAGDPEDLVVASADEATPSKHQRNPHSGDPKAGMAMASAVAMVAGEDSVEAFVVIAAASAATEAAMGEEAALATKAEEVLVAAEAIPTALRPRTHPVVPVEEVAMAEDSMTGATDMVAEEPLVATTTHSGAAIEAMTTVIEIETGTRTETGTAEAEADATTTMDRGNDTTKTMGTTIPDSAEGIDLFHFFERDASNIGPPRIVGWGWVSFYCIRIRGFVILPLLRWPGKLPSIAQHLRSHDDELERQPQPILI
jgi:hypothetical protein